MMGKLLVTPVLVMASLSGFSDDDLSWFSSKDLSFEAKKEHAPTQEPTAHPQPNRGVLLFASPTPAPSQGSEIRRATAEERKNLSGPMVKCRDIFVSSISTRDISQGAQQVLLSVAPNGKDRKLPDTVSLIFSTDPTCSRPPPNPELARLFDQLRQQARLQGAEQ